MMDDSVMISIAPMTSLKRDDSRTPRMLSQIRKTMRTRVSAAQTGLTFLKIQMSMAKYSGGTPMRKGIKKFIYPAEAVAKRAMSMV